MNQQEICGPWKYEIIETYEFTFSLNVQLPNTAHRKNYSYNYTERSTPKPNTNLFWEKIINMKIEQEKTSQGNNTKLNNTGLGKQINDDPTLGYLFYLCIFRKGQPKVSLLPR